MKLTFILLFTSLSFSCFSQNIYKIGARSKALGNASVTLEDIWAYHHNPGMLGYLKKGGIGASYENRYFLKELQYQGITFAQPLKKGKGGVISSGAQFSGSGSYRTLRAGVGYSLKLADFISMGVQINYLNVQQAARYGTKHGFSAEFGLGAKIGQKWVIGASVYNLTRSRFATYQNERFATNIRIGVQYNVAKKVKILLEFEKDMLYPLSIKGGIEYEPVQNLFIRVGAASKPLEFTFGLGYGIKGFRFDVASSYQQILGFTTGASVQYNWRK
ncbi:MAG: hypothetical protein ABI207_01860 [Crocinitomicaceae bacterium]